MIIHDYNHDYNKLIKYICQGLNDWKSFKFWKMSEILIITVSIHADLQMNKYYPLGTGNVFFKQIQLIEWEHFCKMIKW